MKMLDLLSLGEKYLKILSAHGIKTMDYKFIELVREYEAMRQAGDKYSYCILYLSQKYNISESTTKRIIRRIIAKTKEA